MVVDNQDVQEEREVVMSEEMADGDQGVTKVEVVKGAVGVGLLLREKDATEDPEEDPLNTAHAAHTYG